MRHLVLCMLLFAGSAGCSDNPFDKPVENGGSCSYYTSPFSLDVISIERDSSVTYPAYVPDSSFRYLVKVTGIPVRLDTVYLHELVGKEITFGMVTAIGLKAGSVIEGTVDRITTGSCNPVIYKFNDSRLQ